MTAMIFNLEPVYANIVIGVKEQGVQYKLVNAKVQLLSLREVREHKKHIAR